MVETPWGDADALRAQKLAPGPGGSAAEVAESQRRRLLAAMIASVAERGYEETGVADLAGISGVSPRSFYQHFESKHDCFLAAVEGALALAEDRILGTSKDSDWKREVRSRMLAFATFAVEHPAVTKVLLVEAQAAGGEAAERVDAAVLRVEHAFEQRLEGTGLPGAFPREMIVAGLAATIDGVRTRLLDGQTRRLPEFVEQLASFLLELEPPSRPLRVAVRPPERRREEREAGDHAERALRAFESLLTEEDLAEISMEQVAKRAGMSRRTLYANFASREELLLAAVDGAAMQAVAAALPAYRRTSNPAKGVFQAFSALFGMLASRPHLAHLLLVGVRQGGAAALARRSETLRLLDPVLSAGVPAHQRPVSVQIASEALLDGLLGLAARRMSESGAGALAGLVPISSFMVLVPVIGAEQATAAAEGRSYRKPPPAVAEAVLRASARRVSDRLLVAISQAPMTAAELAEETLLSPEETEEQIQILVANGVIEALEPERGPQASRYGPAWGRMDTEEAGERGQAEREAISLEVGRVIQADVEEAFRAGTFDAREDRFLVRVPIWLDEQGWEELLHHLDRALEGSIGIQRRASERLRALGDPDAGSPGRLLFVSFEAPHDGEGATG